MGLCAYLAGWRPESLIERFRAQREDLGVYPFDIAQGSASTAMFAKFDGVDRLHQIADELNLPVVFDPSGQLAELVGVISLEGLALGAPPPFEETLRLFNPDSLAWSDTTSRDEPGLYEFELHGRREHRLSVDGDWRIVDRSTGQLLLLRGRQGLVRWHKPQIDMAEPSAFVVREALAMPQIVERCLASASGLLPVTHRGMRVYRNVSHEVAEELAYRLGCPLEVQNDPMIAPYGGPR